MSDNGDALMDKGYPHGRCTARSKQTGEQCKNAPSVGKTVCHIHGGKTPSGITAPQTIHGRYSKYLPARLAGKYLEAQNDPELLNLSGEIGLVEARIAELLEGVDRDAAGRVWAKIRTAFSDLELAIKSQDGAGTIANMTELDKLTRIGNRDYYAWEEITRLIEQRRKLVDSERKRRVDMQNMITADRAMLLVSAIVGVVRDNVSDRKVLTRISNEIGKLIAHDPA